MPAKLLYRDAFGRDTSVDILPEGVFLGRAQDCAIRTEDAMVSRKNCKISFVSTSGRWVVEDLGSSNGTFVNERRVEKQLLTHSDVVRCGTLQVRFVEVVGEPAVKSRTMSLDLNASAVQVDPSLKVGKVSKVGKPLDSADLIALKEQDLQAAAKERDALNVGLREAEQKLEAAEARREADSAELQKLRAEAITNREKLHDLSRQASLQEEELHAQVKVAEELRRELGTIKEEHLQFKTRAEELSEAVSARDRQLERAHEDVARTKQLVDELRAKMNELQKTKDDGWRELNERVEEQDRLRQVISEQERILEERRVGLISLEAVVKDLRADGERALRELVATKAERDDFRERVTKQQYQIETLEEEVRRLARLMAEQEGGSGRTLGDEQVRIATELRETKIAQKKLEVEHDRSVSRLTEVEAERKTLDEKLVQLQVELDNLHVQKKSVETAQARAEEARARAEAERLRMVEAVNQMQPEVKRLSEQLANREREIRQREQQIEKLTVELSATPLASEANQAPSTSSDQRLREIKERAEEAYTGINDALSELRTNIILAKELVAGQTTASNSDSGVIVETIRLLMDRTEDAKGLLRSLREVIES